MVRKFFFRIFIALAMFLTTILVIVGAYYQQISETYNQKMKGVADQYTADNPGWECTAAILANEYDENSDVALVNCWCE